MKVTDEVQIFRGKLFAKLDNKDASVHAPLLVASEFLGGRSDSHFLEVTNHKDEAGHSKMKRYHMLKRSKGH